MSFTKYALAAALLAATSAAGLADGYPAIKLLATEKSTVGEDLAYPASGKASVSAVIVTLAPGEKTLTHQHGVPMFAYILEGEVTVDYGDKGTKTYHQGEAFMEAMQVFHAGTNSGTVPVKILAVYMGAEGAKDVIPKP